MDEVEEEFRVDLGLQSSINQGGGRDFDVAAMWDMADDSDDDEEKKIGSRGLGVGWWWRVFTSLRTSNSNMTLLKMKAGSVPSNLLNIMYCLAPPSHHSITHLVNYILS